MSETTTTDKATTEKAEPKKSRKSILPKKPKSKIKTSAKAAGAVSRKMNDTPVAERRLAVVKLLRTLGATSATSAVSVSQIAEKLGYTPYDAYCLVYSKFPLVRDGFIKTAKVEGTKGLSAYLTAKGQKQDPGK